MRNSASRASRGGAISAEGAALARLPPRVARLRIWNEPTTPALSAKALKPLFANVDSSIVWAATPAPTLSWPSLVFSKTWSSGTWLTSITRRALTRPFFICGSKSVPPATSLLSDPSPSARWAASRESGSAISNRLMQREIVPSTSSAHAPHVFDIAVLAGRLRAAKGPAPFIPALVEQVRHSIETYRAGTSVERAAYPADRPTLTDATSSDNPSRRDGMVAA